MFCIVYSFVMFVVDSIDAYLSPSLLRTHSFSLSYSLFLSLSLSLVLILSLSLSFSLSLPFFSLNQHVFVFRYLSHAPLSLPHLTQTDTELKGQKIPKNTTVNKNENNYINSLYLISVLSDVRSFICAKTDIEYKK